MSEVVVVNLSDSRWSDMSEQGVDVNSLVLALVWHVSGSL